MKLAIRQTLHLSIFSFIAAMVALGSVRNSHATEYGEKSHRLTPEYLEGRWCYSHIDFGSQREEVGTEYVFNVDGTLEYQVSSRSDNMGSGNYSIESGQLEIRPTMVMFDLMIDQVDDEAFVLDAMGGKHHFLRGECAG
jgi:hypothetical protein